jgi:hypothetical protein
MTNVPAAYPVSDFMRRVRRGFARVRADREAERPARIEAKCLARAAEAERRAQFDAKVRARTAKIDAFLKPIFIGIGVVLAALVAVAALVLFWPLSVQAMGVVALMLCLSSLLGGWDDHRSELRRRNDLDEARLSCVERELFGDEL